MAAAETVVEATVVAVHTAASSEEVKAVEGAAVAWAGKAVVERGAAEMGEEAEV